MFIGFDYGTANCSVAVMRDGKPHLLKMENDSTLLPSMLCAPTREAVSEWLYRHHDVPADDDETQALLRRAIRYNREEDIDVTAKSVQFGLSSLAQYIDDPEEVWFVKSPKSFLGASGLKPQQVALFEDLVCAMMLHIRQQAQAQLPEAITQAVIGRPINFRGLGGDEAKHPCARDSGTRGEACRIQGRGIPVRAGRGWAGLRSHLAGRKTGAGGGYRRWYD